MSPRKPTIDGLDDIDDEDGVLEEEAAEETDLDLTVVDPEDLVQGAIDPEEPRARGAEPPGTEGGRGKAGC
jgi:hypothetical protein